MIGPGTGVRVYLACGPTDMRKGVEGLAALAQDVLRQKAASGAVFAFRGKRGDRLKLLHWVSHWNAIGPRECRSVRHWFENTGARRKQGFCLYYKVLERGRVPWPTTEGGAVRLTSAQLSMLWEGIDWRRPDWGAPPARVG